jgi:cyclopropane fatty-acyl-phospholipid synthase-like methyltransferase
LGYTPAVSRVSFENYGQLAGRALSYTEIAGRYAFQRRQESAIIRDVTTKLALGSTDSLLEVGCGAGNLLIPLSRRVRLAAGLDHSHLLARLRQRHGSEAIRLFPGNFLDVTVTKTFSKILVYSVIHYLSSRSEVLRFLDKAAALLKPGGMMLVGDIPNADKKRRFLATKQGGLLQDDWIRKVNQANAVPVSRPDHKTVASALNDELLLSFVAHFRSRGYEGYLVRQPEGLCFAHTREDLLVTAPRR